MISHLNYEEFIVDYLDERLTKEEAAELLHFIKNNINTDFDLAELKNLKLQPESIIYQKKHLLKKSIISEVDYFEQLSIQKKESSLSNDEIFELNQYLQSSEKKHKEFSILKETFLVPDTKIVFKKKNALKRKTKGKKIKLLIYSISSAAAIGFMVLIAFYKNEYKNDAFYACNNTKTIYHHKSIKAIKNAFVYKSEVATEEILNQQNSFNNRITNKKTEEESSIHKIIADNQQIKIENQSTFTLQSQKPDFNYQLTVKTIRLKTYQASIDNIINEKPEVEETKITFLTIVKGIFKTYNKLTGKSYEIDDEYSQDGKLTALSIQTDNFAFSYSKE